MIVRLFTTTVKYVNQLVVRSAHPSFLQFFYNRIQTGSWNLMCLYFVLLLFLGLFVYMFKYRFIKPAYTPDRGWLCCEILLAQVQTGMVKTSAKLLKPLDFEILTFAKVPRVQQTDDAIRKNHLLFLLSFKRGLWAVSLAVNIGILYDMLNSSSRSVNAREHSP